MMQTQEGGNRPLSYWRVIAVIVALFVGVGTAYAMLTPPFEKPDEHWHFAFAMYLVQTGQLPVQSVDRRDHLAEQEGSQPPLYYATLALLLKVSGLTDLESGYRQLTEVNPYYGGRPGAWRDNGNQFLHTPCRNADCQRTMTAVSIGRGLSLAWGVLALGAAGYALRLVFPMQPALGWLTVGLMAFTPQFLHIASSVSNDSATVAMVAVTVALLARYLIAMGVNRDSPPSLGILLGVAAGLATLAKPSGLSVAVIAGGIVVAVPLIHRRGAWRTAIGTLALFGASFLLVAGWWFARNLMLYGEPTATAIHLQVYGVAPEPLTLRTLRVEWAAVVNSFWASFGWGGINPANEIYAAVRWAVAVCALAFMGVAGWHWRRWNITQRWFVLLLAGQLLLVGLLLFRWMRLTVAPLGRLMFPALLPIAFMIALPLLALVQPRWQRWVATGVMVSWLGVAVACLIFLVRPAYAAPVPLAALPADATPVGAQFGDAIILEGYRISTTPVAPGAEVPLTLYWRTTAPLTESYSVGLKLFGRDEQLLAQVNSHPAGGRAPTAAWPVGAIIADETVLVVASEAIVPTLARLEIDLFRHADLSTLTVTQEGAVIRPFRPVALVVRPDDPSPSAPAPPFAGAFRPVLTEIDLAGNQADITLQWEVGQALNRDYQALLHLAPAPDAAPVAVGDFTPQEGWYPTSLWQGGDSLTDRATLTLPTDAPIGDYGVLVGLYDPVTLERAEGADGQTVWQVAQVRWDGTRWSLPEPAAP